MEVYHHPEVGYKSLKMSSRRTHETIALLITTALMDYFYN